MSRSWTGPLVTATIVAGVFAILFFNYQPDRPSKLATGIVSGIEKLGSNQVVASGNVRENPIGETVIRNHLQINAVWLAGVSMDGMTSGSSASSEIVHLEADVRSTADNPNGFAKDEFVPYLKIDYSILPASGGPAIDRGEMHPMIASDGLHYGVSVAIPMPGKYRLIYEIQPPSSGGLGRHVGAGGVAPWWTPFTAEFEWNVDSASTAALARTR